MRGLEQAYVGMLQAPGGGRRRLQEGRMRLAVNARVTAFRWRPAAGDRGNPEAARRGRGHRAVAAAWRRRSRLGSNSSADAFGRGSLWSLSATGPVVKRDQVVTLHDVAFSIARNSSPRISRASIARSCRPC